MSEKLQKYHQEAQDFIYFRFGNSMEAQRANVESMALVAVMVDVLESNLKLQKEVSELKVLLAPKIEEVKTQKVTTANKK